MFINISDYPDYKNRIFNNNVSFMSILTRMACCMKNIAISRPNKSPATRVNRFIIEHAPRIANKKSKSAVHTQTLRTHQSKENSSVPPKNLSASVLKYTENWRNTILSRLRRVYAPNLFGPSQSWTEEYTSILSALQLQVWAGAVLQQLSEWFHKVLLMPEFVLQSNFHLKQPQSIS